jgi:hypothetical protein
VRANRPRRRAAYESTARSAYESTARSAYESTARSAYESTARSAYESTARSAYESIALSAGGQVLRRRSKARRPASSGRPEGTKPEPSSVRRIHSMRSASP